MLNAPEPSAHSDNMPVVFDLDGTLAEATWPSNHIGAPIHDGIELMLHYSSLGFGIVIHTARPKSHEGRIWRWLEELGLQNVVFDVVCGKPLGWLYVDDRSFCPDYVERSVKVAAPVRDMRVEPAAEDEESAWEPDVTDEGAPPPSANDPELWTVIG